MSSQLQPNDGWPIDAATRTWVDARASWIVEQFGHEWVTSCTIVFPTAEFFPSRFEYGEEDASGLLDRMCGFLYLDPAAVELALCHFPKRVDGGSTPLGVYRRREDEFTVWIERSLLWEPPALAATLAHELCHVHLLGQGRLAGDEDDHEPLTDLLTVFLGLGIITSNSALSELYWHSGIVSGWQMRCRGYITMPTYGYALALFSRLRGEVSPSWRKYLRPDVRSALTKSLKLLGTRGMPDLNAVITTDARPAYLHAEPVEEPSEPVAECVFCGAVLAYAGLCGECQESIEVNRQDLELEQRAMEVAVLRRHRIFTWGCLPAIALFMFLLLLEALGVML